MYNDMLIYERAYLTFLERYEGLGKLVQNSLWIKYLAFYVHSYDSKMTHLLTQCSI